MGVDKLFLDGPSEVVQGRDSEPILQKALDFVTQRLRELFPRQLSGTVQPAAHALEMFDVRPVQVNAGILAHQLLDMEQVKVVIVGHSRGGLIATVLARMLSPLVRVYFLGLYDSVDREPCLDGTMIENVGIVFHARRSPEVGSRWSFGHTSTQHRVDHYEESFFYTSHGGIGGDLVVTKKFGKPIEQICAEGRDNADVFIRNGAKRYGLPLP
jgi:hypothetical protein